MLIILYLYAVFLNLTTIHPNVISYMVCVVLPKYHVHSHVMSEIELIIKIYLVIFVIITIYNCNFHFNTSNIKSSEKQ